MSIYLQQLNAGMVRQRPDQPVTLRFAVTLFEARVVIGDFKDDHNHRHRHSALGYRTPAEYAAGCRCTHTPVACEIN